MKTNLVIEKTDTKTGAEKIRYKMHPKMKKKLASYKARKLKPRSQRNESKRHSSDNAKWASGISEGD